MDNILKSEPKNIFDTDKIINECIQYYNDNGERIVQAQVNQSTMDYLRSMGITGFGDMYSRNIPIVIDNSRAHYEVVFVREKITEPTPYEPYGCIGDDAA